MNIEKLGALIGILVVGGGVLIHSINMQNKINIMYSSHESSIKSINTLTREILVLKTEYSNLKEESAKKNEKIVALEAYIIDSHKMLTQVSMQFLSIIER